MHRPVHKARKRFAFVIEERHHDNLIVGKLSGNDAVVVETGDDFFAHAAGRRSRVGAALFEALTDGIEEPAIVVLVEFSRPPAAVVSDD